MLALEELLGAFLEEEDMNLLLDQTLQRRARARAQAGALAHDAVDVRAIAVEAARHGLVGLAHAAGVAWHAICELAVLAATGG